MSKTTLHSPKWKNKTHKENYDLFSERINHVPQSFLREILKLTSKPDIISFAGGLPNPNYFPLEEIRHTSMRILENEGLETLQYSTTEGFLPLREWIAERYLKRFGIKISPDEILITNGSQQG